MHAHNSCHELPAASMHLAVFSLLHTITMQVSDPLMHALQRADILLLSTQCPLCAVQVVWRSQYRSLIQNISLGQQAHKTSVIGVSL